MQVGLSLIKMHETSILEIKVCFSFSSLLPCGAEKTETDRMRDKDKAKREADEGNKGKRTSLPVPAGGGKDVF